jgi:Rod binding domain-containing protein
MNDVLGVRAAAEGAFDGATATRKTAAGQDFEALLIAQLLRSAREGVDDASSNAAMDFAEQQLASVIAAKGGLGIGSLVMKGLEAPDQKPDA